MIHLKNLILISIPVAVALGCGSGDVKQDQGASTSNTNTANANLSTEQDGQWAPEELKPVQEWSGTNAAATESQRQVAGTVDQWKAVWEVAHGNEQPPPELPDFDFEKHMVIAVFMGQKNTGGYSIRIMKIEKRDRELTVAVHEEGPGRNDITTQALTSPYHLVVVPTSNGVVEFVDFAHAGG